MIAASSVSTVQLEPSYLRVTADALGHGTPVQVRILGDMASLAQDLALTIKQEVLAAQAAGPASDDGG